MRVMSRSPTPLFCIGARKDGGERAFCNESRLVWAEYLHHCSSPNYGHWGDNALFVERDSCPYLLIFAYEYQESLCAEKGERSLYIPHPCLSVSLSAQLLRPQNNPRGLLQIPISELQQRIDTEV